MRTCAITPALAAAALLLAACGGHPAGGGPTPTPSPTPAATRTPTATPEGTGGETVTGRRQCFGAAARDPSHPPCDDPQLRLSVVPALSRRMSDRATPCTREAPLGMVEPCAFGVPAARAHARFALVGDSHAAHLRSAFAVVARAQGWRGYALTRNACAYVPVGRPLPEPEFSQCAAWKQQLPGWFASHPEVNTAFVVGLTRDAGDPPGAPDPFAAKVAGYVEAWSRLPASVTHIVVIRDTPETREETPACIGAALARGRPPGPGCAVPRTIALPPDPAAVAAAQLRSPRVQTIDLTRFFCDLQWCYPVVGGVLVYKDITHITPLFAKTLGPFLEAEVERVTAAWR